MLMIRPETIPKFSVSGRLISLSSHFVCTVTRPPMTLKLLALL